MAGGQTALERQHMVVRGERAELRLEDGHLTLYKDATTQDRPTEVTVPVGQVRGAELETPSRGGVRVRRGATTRRGRPGGAPARPGRAARGRGVTDDEFHRARQRLLG